MIDLLIKNFGLVLLASMHLLYAKIKNLPIIICNLAIILAFFNGIDAKLLLEISALLSIFATTIHNRLFKISGVFHISIVSLGFLMLAIYEVNIDFLRSLLLSLPFINQQNLQIAESFYLLLSIGFIIGFLPFTEWIIYLFTISNTLFKLICFITPMTLSLYVLNPSSALLNITPLAYKIYGALACGYAGICMLFNNNIRACFVELIVYFYGLAIVSFGYTNMLSLQSTNIWLFYVAILLAMTHTFTNKRTINYNLKNIKSLLFSTKTNAILSIMCIIALICNYVIIVSLFDVQKSLTKIIILAFFIVFLAKFLFILIKSKQTSKNNGNKTNNDTQLLRQIKLGLILFLVYFSNYLLIFNQKIHLSLPSALISIIFAGIFILGFCFSFLLIDFSQPKILISKTYSTATILVIKAVKVVFGILHTIIVDFYKTLDDSWKQLYFSQAPRKLSNILYNNQIYFYIFFLAQVVIVLIIECVIL